MAQALPLTKLAGLLVKTLAKPLSKRIKHECSRNRYTRQLLTNIGQASHTLTSKLTIWSAGYKVRSITPLEDEKALSVGAEFVGETFLLLVSGGWLLYEYNSSQEKALEKSRQQRLQAAKERQALQQKLHTLDVRLQAIEDVVKANHKSPFMLLGTGQRYVEPDQREIVPIDDDHDDSATTSIEDNTDNDDKDVITTAESQEKDVVGESKTAKSAESTSNVTPRPGTSDMDEPIPTTTITNGTKPWWRRWPPW